MLKNLDDLLEFVQLESFGEHYQVGSSLVPVSDLIKWNLDGVVSWGILVRNQFLDLLSPVNHRGFKSLEEILVLGSGVNVSEILIWDVKESLSSSSVSGLVQEGHELVEVHDKVLLDTIRPVIFLKKFLNVFSLHLLKQIV